MAESITITSVETFPGISCSQLPAKGGEKIGAGQVIGVFGHEFELEIGRTASLSNSPDRWICRDGGAPCDYWDLRSSGIRWRTAEGNWAFGLRLGPGRIRDLVLRRGMAPVAIVRGRDPVFALQGD